MFLQVWRVNYLKRFIQALNYSVLSPYRVLTTDINTALRIIRAIDVFNIQVDQDYLALFNGHYYIEPAIKTDNLEIVWWFTRLFGQCSFYDYYVYAANLGCINILRWLHTFSRLPPLFIINCVKWNNQKAFDWFRANYPNSDIAR